MDGKSLLAQEWNTLQDNCEQYEKSALTIKLVAMFFFDAWTCGGHIPKLAGYNYFALLGVRGDGENIPIAFGSSFA